jgi:hypothetical protein
MESALFTIAIVIILLVTLPSYWSAIARLKVIEWKLNALLRHHGVDHLPLSDRVKEVAADPKRKIEAIKIYREDTGASLLEAKEAVESFFESNYRRSNESQ